MFQSYQQAFSGLLGLLIVIPFSICAEPLNASFIPRYGLYKMSVFSADADAHLNRESGIAMSNEDLLLSAATLKDNRLSIEQRFLNYQWLANQENIHAGVRIGNKALSQLIRQSIKIYWQRTIKSRYADNHLVPSADGTGKFKPELDYHIKLSDDELKLALRYDF